MIPWDMFEKKYKHLFRSKIENVAKPLRMTLGALIIQTRFQYSDREFVQQIMENPYPQHFIGLPGYQKSPPFDASTLVLFRQLEDTQFTSIALSVFVANIVRRQQRILSALFYLLDILNYREGWLSAYAG